MLDKRLIMAAAIVIVLAGAALSIQSSESHVESSNVAYIEGQEYSLLKSTISAAQAGDIIRLVADMTEDITVTSNTVA